MEQIKADKIVMMIALAALTCMGQIAFGQGSGNSLSRSHLEQCVQIDREITALKSDLKLRQDQLGVAATTDEIQTLGGAIDEIKVEIANWQALEHKGKCPKLTDDLLSN